MPVFWLTEKTIAFPNPELANGEGILAVGGDLSPDRLLYAYSIGVFPWFNPEDPIIWWSPDPRFVLFPNELKVSKSMRPYFNQHKFDWTLDEAFEEVIRACAKAPRKGQLGGTWISSPMIDAYNHLHELGYAHSVEVWQDGCLVGGLYGIALGKCFFGESMFATVSNASKFGFISLVRWLEAQGYWLVDCQQKTKHLERLGGRSIPRKEFLKWLQDNEQETTKVGKWTIE